MASAASTSHSLPVVIHWLKPMPLRSTMSIQYAPSAPLWLTNEKPPCRIALFSSAVVNVAIRPERLLATPRQLGPTIATPCSRANWVRRAWRARPASSSSANPDENTTKAFTPAAMPSRMASSTRCAAVPTMARSTGLPIAARLG
ncbi:hypothetical protein D3C86_979610 [compost metagenome]